MKRIVIGVSSDDEDQRPAKILKVGAPVVEKDQGIRGMTREERESLEEARRARAAAALARGAPTASLARSKANDNNVATLASAPVPRNFDKTSSAPGSKLPFPRATVKRTYNRFYPSDKRALSIHQVLGEKKHIKSIVAAAYCNDLEWLATEVFTEELDTTLVCHKGDGKAGERLLRRNFRLIFPPISSTMHIKFFLIFYDVFTRVVIPSANLEAYDWNTIENPIWIHDFPLRDAGPEGIDTFALTDFGQVWERTLRALHVPENRWRAQMQATDFSDADDKCRLVLSWPGKYSAQGTRSGHRMLAKQIRDLGVSPPENHTLQCEYNTSSVGSYTHEWLEEFYASLLGAEPSMKRRFKSRADVPVNFVFPSWKTVKESKLGPRGGGTLFFPLYSWKEQKNNWIHNDYCLARVRDGISQRPGILQHTKTIIALFKPQQEAKPLEGTAVRGWAYVGSHNYTPSAWGRKATKQGEIEVVNAEFGVIFKLEAASDDAVERMADEIATWERPVVRYEKDRRGRPGDPWMEKQWRDDKSNPSFSMYHDIL